MFQSVVTALLLAAPLVLGFSTDGTMLIKSVCITFEVQSHYTTAYPEKLGNVAHTSLTTP